MPSTLAAMWRQLRSRVAETPAPLGHGPTSPDRWPHCSRPIPFALFSRKRKKMRESECRFAREQRSAAVCQDGRRLRAPCVLEEGVLPWSRPGFLRSRSCLMLWLDFEDCSVDRVGPVMP